MRKLIAKTIIGKHFADKDADFTQDWYVEQAISLTRTGNVKLSYV